MQRTKQQLPLEGSGEKPVVSGNPLPAAETRDCRESRKYTYSTYKAMLSRCYKKITHGYHNYGGRGITVCERWRASFQNFLDDMGQRPIGHVIERVNVNGNYEPSNCKWIPKTLSSRNRRRERVPWIDGETAAQHRKRVVRDWYFRNHEKSKAYRRKYYLKTQERWILYARAQRKRMRMEKQKC